jgi:hypothetical protein
MRKLSYILVLIICGCETFHGVESKRSLSKISDKNIVCITDVLKSDNNIKFMGYEKGTGKASTPGGTQILHMTHQFNYRIPAISELFFTVGI